MRLPMEFQPPRDEGNSCPQKANPDMGKRFMESGLATAIWLPQGQVGDSSAEYTHPPLAQYCLFSLLEPKNMELGGGLVGCSY